MVAETRFPHEKLPPEKGFPWADHVEARNKFAPRDCHIARTRCIYVCKCTIMCMINGYYDNSNFSFFFMYLHLFIVTAT